MLKYQFGRLYVTTDVTVLHKLSAFFYIYCKDNSTVIANLTAAVNSSGSLCHMIHGMVHHIRFNSHL